MIQPHFTNIHTEIIRNLDSAKFRILVCMAWFTDPEILEVMRRKMREGIKVEIILLDDESNRIKGTSPVLHPEELDNFKIGVKHFRSEGGDLTLVQRPLDFFLHSKFCVIDDDVVITGSYNWSAGARSNIENIVVITDQSIATLYSEEFFRIKGRKFELLKERALAKCRRCSGHIFNARFYDHREHGDFQTSFRDVSICTEEPLEHVQFVSAGETIPYIAEIFEDEYERLDAETNVNNESSKRIVNRRIGDEIAKRHFTRNDSFGINLRGNILLIGVIEQRLDGHDNEYETVDFYWSHELIEDIKEVLSSADEYLIEKLDEITH